MQADAAGSVEDRLFGSKGPPTARRVFAALFDLLLLSVVSMSIVFPAFHDDISQDESPLIGGWHLVLVMVVGAPYYVVLETLFGRTFGKVLFGIKVATLDGGFIRWRVVIRNLVRVLCWGFPILGLYLLLLDVGLMETTRRKQRLGDLVAGTTVVRRPVRLFRRGSSAGA